MGMWHEWKRHKCNYFSGDMRRRINLIEVRIYVWLVHEKDEQDAQLFL